MDKNQETRVGGREVKKNALLQLPLEPPNVPLVDSPGGSVVKELPANAGDMGSIPGLGRSHMLRSN